MTDPGPLVDMLESTQPVDKLWITLWKGGGVLVKDAARIAAENLLESHWDLTFPVDPVAIADALKIKVQFTSLVPGVSGAIVAEDGNAEILIEESENYGRQMFTTAHELGHYIERLDKADTDYSFVERRTQKYSLHELYADVFAANLLMPESAFRSQWAASKSEYMLAAWFGVSPAAVLKRKEILQIE